MPTVALRLNYILWLEDIMTECRIEQPRGIDIGNEFFIVNLRTKIW